MDVVVLRQDLPSLQRYLQGWTLMAADPPGTLRYWQSGESLPKHVHDVWCRPRESNEWALQLMVIDPVGDDWVYRRAEQIRRPMSTIAGPASTEALPVLAPEIQLLYKSHRPRPKDQQDFEVIVEHLRPEQREWLGDALRSTDPEHVWLADL